MDEAPDYSRYSVTQLSDALTRIIKEDAPDPYWLVVEELARRFDKPPQEPRFVEEPHSMPELVFSEPPPILQWQLLNAAEYGSIGLLVVAWLIYENSVNPRDMSIGGSVMLFTLIVFSVAALGFSQMRHTLHFLEDQEFALHQSLVALFWAPPSCLIGGIALGYCTDFFIFLFSPVLMLCFTSLCFIAPFVIMTVRAKKVSKPRQRARTRLF